MLSLTRKKRSSITHFFYYLGIVLFSVHIASAEVQAREDSLFVKGNEFYKNQQYREAIQAYEKVITQGYQHVYLYYNLANAYIKTKQIGKSILHYENALLLDPDFADAKYNLSLAKKYLVDDIESIAEPVTKKISRFFIFLFSYQTWSWLMVSFLWLACSAFVLFLFSRKSNHRRITFILFIVFGFMGIVSMLFEHLQILDLHHNRYAVLTANNSYIKNEPDRGSTDAFIIHEGTKVKILDDDRADWYYIRLTDGKQGWIETKDIGVISVNSDK